MNISNFVHFDNNRYILYLRPCRDPMSNFRKPSVTQLLRSNKHVCATYLTDRLYGSTASWAYYITIEAKIYLVEAGVEPLPPQNDKRISDKSVPRIVMLCRLSCFCAYATGCRRIRTRYCRRCGLRRARGGLRRIWSLKCLKYDRLVRFYECCIFAYATEFCEKVCTNAFILILVSVGIDTVIRGWRVKALHFRT